MEGLIALIAELLLAPLIAGIAALVQLVSFIGSLIFELVLGRTRKPKATQPRKPSLSPRIRKWILRITAGLIAFSAIALLVLNVFFLERATRAVVKRVETKTGIALHFESMRGNLFTGTFTFSGVSINQDDQSQTNYQIDAETVEANLSILHLLVGSRTLDFAAIRNAQAHFETALADADRETEGPDGKKQVELRIPKLPKFEITRLEISDFEIAVVDNKRPDPVSYQANVSRLDTAPLRSRYLWFDILFRSNLDATLNESSVRIVNSDTDGLRSTHWSTSDIDARVLASLVGGPFSLFESGKVAVEIQDEWEIDRRQDIEMAWKLSVSNARAAVPASTHAILRPLAQVVVDNINAQEEDWTFGFHLTLSEAQFEGAASLNAKQIWQNALPVMLKQAAELTGVETDKIKGGSKKAFDTFKSFLEKRKTKED